MKSKRIKIAMLTSGGDAPGMNKCLASICEYALTKNIDSYVIINGFEGLVNNDIRPADLKRLKNNENLAGSNIFCNRYDGIKDKQNLLKAIENLKKHEIEYLIILGGNGSYMGAKLFANENIKVLCIPCTIDNDIDFTQYTIGFISAINSIVQNINALKATAYAHGNVYLIEIMGRQCTDLTISAAIAANVDYIITNKNKLTNKELIDLINKFKEHHKRDILILITENLYEHQELNELAKNIKYECNLNAKVHILGFVQRGATPTGLELFNAARFGYYAIECIINGKYNIALCLNNNKLSDVDLLTNNFQKKDSFDQTYINDKINHY